VCTYVFHPQHNKSKNIFSSPFSSFLFFVFVRLCLFREISAKKLEMNRDSSKTPSASPSMVLSGALKLLPVPKQRDQITCWMDIVAGTDPTGNPVEGYLRVGQEATVVVRVRQTGKK
jgi:hypothetical protein